MIHYLDPAVRRKLDKLFELAAQADDLDVADMALMEHWSALRETYGLAKLLLIVQFHVQTK